MTAETSVGKFESLMIMGIGGIVGFYFAGSSLFNLDMPSLVAWILLLFILGYFFNRIIIKWEHWVDGHILIARMKAEMEKQLAMSQIIVAESELAAARLKEQPPKVV